jgi:hypothetical protein
MVARISTETMGAEHAPAPNRRPRFLLGTLHGFLYLLSAPPASPAEVGEARCSA